jgi:KDO2-lipid IV(A) lauroyltransferase
MPDTDPDEDKAIYNTVLRINQWVEARIREAPEQWFWMHNRWPKEAWVKAGVLED